MKYYNSDQIDADQFDSIMAETVNNNVVIINCERTVYNELYIYFQIDGVLFKVFENNDIIAYNKKLYEIIHDENDDDKNEDFILHNNALCDYIRDGNRVIKAIQCGFEIYSVNDVLKANILNAKKRIHITLNTHNNVVLSEYIHTCISNDSKKVEFVFGGETLCTFVLDNKDDMIIDQSEYKKLLRILINNDYNGDVFHIEKKTVAKKVEFELIG